MTSKDELHRSTQDLQRHTPAWTTGNEMKSRMRPTTKGEWRKWAARSRVAIEPGHCKRRELAGRKMGWIPKHPPGHKWILAEEFGLARWRWRIRSKRGRDRHTHTHGHSLTHRERDKQGTRGRRISDPSTTTWAFSKGLGWEASSSRRALVTILDPITGRAHLRVRVIGAPVGQLRDLMLFG